MQYSDLAVQHIHNAIDHIQADRISPAALSPDMFSYFIDLAARDIPHLAELGAFLTALPLGALEDALLQQATPPEHREFILKMRKQHEALQDQLENEIQNQRFENAAVFRDRQKEVIQAIRTILSGNQIQITPSVVKHALKSLGWQHM